MTTISINWIIKQLSVKKTEGEFSDVVITAVWSCRGSDGTYGAVVTGTSSFAPPTESFTPYPDLSEAQVLDWCYANGVNKSAVEANVTQQIADQVSAQVETLPLPWLPPVMIVPPMLPQVEPPLVDAETPVAAVDTSSSELPAA